ncbi:UpxY family transcription antiterminator [Flavobacterium sp. ZT3R18]|uniref:UpxY family transcription antiterminator n=1 Tax=Flavobacterium sp. ZT3R18 TaxID=2594429 RepID=UPI00117B251B|nr:UpxY family transcription antiterminator [Flavobacterium sp. ZT3R18]TRX31185.1 UpxY family transcription antiterminator [Flavobacterium sp. ZT3R18]
MERKQGWHVLYVKYRHESKVYKELTEKNIEAFLPMATSIRKWSDRTKKIETPLFPSYVFVNIKSHKDFHDVLTVDSGCSYLSFGGQYGMVSPKEIQQIRLLVEGKDVSDVQINTALPQIGDKLKIEYGELSGLECEVFRIDNQHRISVRLSSLRQNISAIVPLSYLSAPTENTFAKA